MTIKLVNYADELCWWIIRGGPAPEDEAGSSDAPKPSYFKGSGYKLGSEEEPSSVVNPIISTSEEDDDSLEPVSHFSTWGRRYIYTKQIGKSVSFFFVRWEAGDRKLVW